MEQQKLPNAVLALVLSIISLPLCLCYGFGVVLAIVAVVLAAMALKKYKADPEAYTGKGQAQAGLIIGIASIVINLVYLGIVIWVISLVGFENLQNPEEAERAVREALGG